MAKLKIKDLKLKKIIGKSGRKGASEDFTELLKRAIKYKKLIKKNS